MFSLDSEIWILDHPIGDVIRIGLGGVSLVEACHWGPVLIFLMLNLEMIV